MTTNNLSSNAYHYPGIPPDNLRTPAEVIEHTIRFIELREAAMVYAKTSESIIEQTGHDLRLLKRLIYETGINQERYGNQSDRFTMRISVDELVKPGHEYQFFIDPPQMCTPEETLEIAILFLKNSEDVMRYRYEETWFFDKAAKNERLKIYENTKEHVCMLNYLKSEMEKNVKNPTNPVVQVQHSLSKEYPDHQSYARYTKTNGYAYPRKQIAESSRFIGIDLSED